MKVLALDTSSNVLSIAILEDQKLIAEYFLNHKKTHSRKLIPAIIKILKDIELLPRDIDIFSASVGPGSFTGVRIGVTVTKSLAYSFKKPVVSVNTLDALANNVLINDTVICPIINARNEQVYTAIYLRNNKKVERISDYKGMSIHDFLIEVKNQKRNAVFLGDGIFIHKELIKDALGKKCSFMPAFLNMQRASCVAQIALTKASKGHKENCFEMVPFYLRKSQAERMYEENKKE